jgi:pantoate--beta-alanine ligase
VTAVQAFQEIEPMQRWLSGRRAGRRVVFVPTMGALHEGHGACVRLAGTVERALVVASVFVNPTQFGPGEDLDRYPRTLDRDLEKLRAWGCDAAFIPATEVVYPVPQRAWVEVEGLAEPLCGRSRPGHFRGVATVVCKLFGMVRPDVAVFGQKDAQQALVVRALVEQLNLGVELRLAATVREPDGLAMSSRNRHLDAEDRRRAVGLHRSLDAARHSLLAGERDARALERSARDALHAAGIERIDYVELRRAGDLSPLERAEGRVILAIAAYAGPTRLIDNMVFEVSGASVDADVPLF